jgi:hypothetical protein
MPRRLAFPVLLLIPLLALAQSAYVDLEKRLTPEQLHATGLDTLSPAQLALLNRLLRADAATAPASSTMTAESATTAPTAQPAPMHIGLEEGPVHSRLVGTLDGWAPGTVFVLANGQKWKVLKGSYHLRAPVQSPEVDIVPGIAGRWFFKLDEDTPGPRVYRVE